MATSDYASPAQARLMRGVAHGWKPDRLKGGPTRAVAQEFVQAKDRTRRPVRKATGGGPLRLMGRQTAGGTAGRILGRGHTGPLAMARQGAPHATFAKGGSIKSRLATTQGSPPPGGVPPRWSELSSHPSAEELAKSFGIEEAEVYDAFANVGQHVGNVPRRAAVSIVQSFLEGN